MFTHCLNFKRRPLLSILLIAGTVLFPVLQSRAQSAPSSSGAASAPLSQAETPIVLSPFQVQGEKDGGYVATSTLAGSRLNTSLQNTPASISVFTRDFLNDIGAVNLNQALAYTLNGGADTTDATGNQMTGNEAVVQLRSFSGTQLTRDYFSWGLGSDSFNLERLDLARGPNSVLYGIGGPGGVINSTTKRARIGGDLTQLRFRVARWGDQRAELDASRTLVPGKLALRVNVLAQNRDSYLEFSGEERQAIAGAVTYRPFPQTEIRVQGEYGDVFAVLEQSWPAQEKYLTWVANGSRISEVFGEATPGTSANANRAAIYDAFGPLGPTVYAGGRVSTPGPGAPSLGNNTVVITDENILPRFANIAGKSVWADYDYSTWAVFIEQKIGPFALEAAYNRWQEHRNTSRGMAFNFIGLQVDVNRYLPDGRLNPNVGRYFAEGVRLDSLRNLRNEEARMTLAYDLDLRNRSKWLGKHMAVGFLSRRERTSMDDNNLAEVNLTPAGNATYPASLANGNNLIYRRVYLDFTSSDPRLRGAPDPRDYPVNSNGMKSGLVRFFDASTNDLNRIDTAMLATHGQFWDERLVVTTGLRRDRQENWGSTADLNGNGTTADDRDPITQVWPKRRRLGTSTVSAGNTRTYGGVFHATSWAAVVYNNSNSFIPQAAINFFGNQIGDRRGKGEDIGLRFSLPDNRLYATLTRYKTSDANRSVGLDNVVRNNVDAIWRTLGSPEKLLPGNGDVQDSDGKGWEAEITANPTRSWRIAINGSRTEQVIGSTHLHSQAYIAANRSVWQQNSARVLDSGGGAGVPTIDPVTGGPATIANSLAAIDGVFTGLLQQLGRQPRQLRRYSGNLFTVYSFQHTGPAWLKDFSLGGGINYRGDQIVGYDTTRGNAPISKGAYTLVNVMAGYDFKLPRAMKFRLQVNVDNLFNDDELIVTDADQNQNWRYLYQVPRRWSVTGTVSF